MPLFRLLALTLLIWVAYLVLKRFLRKVRQPTAKLPLKNRVTRVLRCQRCGVHIPEHEAIHKDGKVYCCERHSR